MESVENLDDLLKKLVGAIPEVKAAAIVSTEGLPIALALPQGIEETKFAAMIAALFLLSEKAINEMHRGEYDQLYIKGTSGYLLIQSVSINPTCPNAILALLTNKEGLPFKFNKEFYGFDRFPYPYIFTHPRPPDDFAGAAQVQVRTPLKEKEPKEEIYCQYCGMKVTKEEQLTHSCKKKPKNT